MNDVNADSIYYRVHGRDSSSKRKFLKWMRLACQIVFDLDEWFTPLIGMAFFGRQRQCPGLLSSNTLAIPRARCTYAASSGPLGGMRVLFCHQTCQAHGVLALAFEGGWLGEQKCQ